MADPQREIAMLGPSFWLNEVADFLANDPRDFGNLSADIRALAVAAKSKQDEHFSKELRQLSSGNVVKVLFGQPAMCDECGRSDGTHRAICKSPTAIELRRRVWAVADAAVEWHQAGREGDEWWDAAEQLTASIEKLLELRLRNG